MSIVVGLLYILTHFTTYEFSRKTKFTLYYTRYELELHNNVELYTLCRSSDFHYQNPQERLRDG